MLSDEKKFPRENNIGRYLPADGYVQCDSVPLYRNEYTINSWPTHKKLNDIENRIWYSERSAFLKSAHQSKKHVNRG